MNLLEQIKNANVSVEEHGAVVESPESVPTEPPVSEVLEELDVLPETDSDIIDESNSITELSNDIDHANNDLTLLSNQVENVATALEDPEYKGMDEVGLENFVTLTYKIDQKYSLETSTESFVGMEDFAYGKTNREKTEIALEGAVDVIKNAGDKFLSLGKRAGDALSRKVTGKYTDYASFIEKIDKTISDIKALEDNFGKREKKASAILLRAFPGFAEINVKTINEFVDRQYEALATTKVAYDKLNKSINNSTNEMKAVFDQKFDSKEKTIKALEKSIQTFNLGFGGVNKPLVSGYWSTLNFSLHGGEVNLIRKEHRNGNKIKSAKLITPTKKELISCLENVKALLKANAELNKYINEMHDYVGKLTSKFRTIWEGVKNNFLPYVGNSMGGGMAVAATAKVIGTQASGMVLFVAQLRSAFLFFNALFRCPMSMIAYTSQYNLLNVYLTRNAIRFAEASISK